MSASSQFHDACRSALVAPGVYERDLDRTYWGHESQFGGYVQALVVQAMRDEVADDEFAPVSMSEHFIRPFGDGTFRCEVEIVRRGRNLINVAARAYDNMKLAGQAIATFARRRELNTLPLLAPPPELAQPVGDDEPPFDHGMGIPVQSLFDMWPRVGSLHARALDGNRVGGWVRMRDHSPMDELMLVMLNDVWPPVAYHVWSTGSVAVSADITTQFRGALPAAIAHGEPVFLQLRTAGALGGFVDEDTEVWSAAGELLCQGRQMRFVHG